MPNLFGFHPPVIARRRKWNEEIWDGSGDTNHPIPDFPRAILDQRYNGDKICGGKQKIQMGSENFFCVGSGVGNPKI